MFASYFTDELMEVLKQEAKKESRSRSNYVEVLLVRAMVQLGYNAEDLIRDFDD